MVQISLYMANFLGCLFLIATLFYVKDSDKKGKLLFIAGIACLVTYFGLSELLQDGTSTLTQRVNPSDIWYISAIEQLALACLVAALAQHYQLKKTLKRNFIFVAICTWIVSIFFGPQIFSATILLLGATLIYLCHQSKGLSLYFLTSSLIFTALIKIASIFINASSEQAMSYLILSFSLAILLLEEYKQVLILRANSDPLSGLPNRRSLNNYADTLFQSHQPYWLVLIQVDGIKQINDAYGYASGDKAIQLASQTMKKHVKENDFLGRNFAKEFVLISTQDKESLMDSLAKLQQDITQIRNINEHKVSLSLHCGIAQNKDCKEEFAYILKASSAALLHAENNKLISAFVSSEMLASVNRRLNLETALRTAIEEKTLNVNFQPKFSCKQPDKIVGAEALARWTHEGEFISPFEFIALAEECNLIADLDRVIMEKAWLVGQKLACRGFPVKIAANFSPTSLLAGVSLTDMVKGIIEQHDLNPKLIEIEITESYLAHGSDINSQLQELKDMGISVAMDDFGTGFSNLGQLEALPLDTLKIDKIFIDNLLENPTVTEFIVDLAKKLHLQLVAEGVEETKQLQWLETHQCHTIQGYLLSKPLSEQDFTALICQPSTEEDIDSAASA